MTAPRRFPAQVPGRYYLTEGGPETEIMYRFGFELPEFAMYPLLDDPDALAALRGMFTRYLDVVEAHGAVALVGGLDYRASPDWAGRLGLDAAGLAEAQRRCVDFLRDVVAPYAGRIPEILLTGIVGPRGDAYETSLVMSAAEAEDYHAVQAGLLAEAGVDLVTALTFNAVDEAVGVARAVAAVDLPLALCFTLDERHRLQTGPSLREAIEATDALAGEARPDFYGINCSHPLEFLPALEPGDWLTRIRMLRPNASSKEKVELCQIGHLEEGDPEELGRQLGELARRLPHVDIWGGCCGTWEKHLDQIARHVVDAP